MTYKQAYDKIIEAYFKDEIKPYDAKYCFCGTLCDNKSDWGKDSFNRIHNDYGDYLGVEYVKMERALLAHIMDTCRLLPNYEERLFSGMSAALDVLKQIHIERGEIIDEIPEFTKRNICATKN